MTRDIVLGQAVIGTDTTTRKVGLALGGALLIALAAQVSVPMFPVPMTLQTLAVLLVGLTLGARLGAATVATYLGYGAMGLPVFSGGMSAAALMGPTAGFLFGFVAMAWLAGLAAERGIARGFAGTLMAALLVSAALYLPGLAWLATFTGMEKAVALGALPFLVGDVVKAAIAALVVSGGWAALKGLRR